MDAPPDSQDSARWARVQRGLGLGPLSLFAVYHLWQNWPAIQGRAAWLARVHDYGPTLLASVVVLLLFVGHALLGFVRLAVRARSRARVGGSGRASFQGLSGLVLLGFLLYHVPAMWSVHAGQYAASLQRYERLWQLLGHPLQVVIYVVGCAALVLHLVHGWFALWQTRARGRTSVALRGVTALVGALLFVLYLQVIGRFALGEPVLPFGTPQHTVTAAAP